MSGCEQIQGYYYGKPMTPEALYAACDKGTYSVESRAESHLYCQVGQADISADEAIASAQALHIYQAKFEDITEELQYDDKVRQTDDVMRNLCRMYQNVFFLDVQEDICDVLVGM